MWLTPNEIDNMHGYGGQAASIAAGDNYLGQLIPQILKSRIFTTQNAALMLLWDEPTTCSASAAVPMSCPVPAILLGPAIRRNFLSISHYNHYSIIATIESLWNFSPMTANDSNASVMVEFFVPFFKFSIRNSGVLRVVQGGSGYEALTLQQASGAVGSNKSLALSCSGIPSGASCTFPMAATSCGSPCIITARITTSVNTPITQSNLTITSNWGGQTNSTNFVLNVLRPFQLRGDVNGDCRVDILDLTIVASNFGQRVTPGTNPRSDIDLSGSIDLIDLVLVASFVGSKC